MKIKFKLQLILMAMPFLIYSCNSNQKKKQTGAMSIIDMNRTCVSDSIAETGDTIHTPNFYYYVDNFESNLNGVNKLNQHALGLSKPYQDSSLPVNYIYISDSSSLSVSNGQISIGNMNKALVYKMSFTGEPGKIHMRFGNEVLRQLGKK